jgi:hypothetical protein
MEDKNVTYVLPCVISASDGFTSPDAIPDITSDGKKVKEGKRGRKEGN